jgi:hypothetical protein
MIAKDKQLHAAAGAAIAFLVSIFADVWIVILAPVFLVALAWEVVRYIKFGIEIDFYDVVATVLGGFATIGLLALFT